MRKLYFEPNLNSISPKTEGAKVDPADYFKLNGTRAPVDFYSPDEVSAHLKAGHRIVAIWVNE